MNSRTGSDGEVACLGDLGFAPRDKAGMEDRRVMGQFLPFAPIMSLMAGDWPDTSRGPCPAVMLRHELPGDDRSWHVDWMLAREPQATSPLICFRLERPLHELPVGAAMIAERIQDHRTAYLTYEGPISGNRGRVLRIAEGQTLAVRCGESGRMELDFHWRLPGDASEEITVGVVPEENSANCQVKMLAISPSSRYK